MTDSSDSEIEILDTPRRDDSNQAERRRADPDEVIEIDDSDSDDEIQVVGVKQGVPPLSPVRGRTAAQKQPKQQSPATRKRPAPDMVSSDRLAANAVVDLSDDRVWAQEASLRDSREKAKGPFTTMPFRGTAMASKNVTSSNEGDDSDGDKKPAAQTVRLLTMDDAVPEGFSEYKFDSSDDEMATYVDRIKRSARVKPQPFHYMDRAQMRDARRQAAAVLPSRATPAKAAMRQRTPSKPSQRTRPKPPPVNSHLKSAPANIQLKPPPHVVKAQLEKRALASTQRTTSLRLPPKGGRSARALAKESTPAGPQALSIRSETDIRRDQVRKDLAANLFNGRQIPAREESNVDRIQGEQVCEKQNTGQESGEQPTGEQLCETDRRALDASLLRQERSDHQDSTGASERIDTAMAAADSSDARSTGSGADSASGATVAFEDDGDDFARGLDDSFWGVSSDKKKYSFYDDWMEDKLLAQVIKRRSAVWVSEDVSVGGEDPDDEDFMDTQCSDDESESEDACQSRDVSIPPSFQQKIIERKDRLEYLSSYEAPWETSGYESDSTPVIEDYHPKLPFSANCVEHLSKHTFDSRTGLPICHFTVYGETDEILYYFKIDIRASSVAKPGKGAFLTFLGAKELKPHCKEKGIRKMKYWIEKSPEDIITMLPLQVVTPRGYNATLRLTGENLHGNNNNIYWPMTMQPLEAIISPGRRRLQVKLQGENLHYDSEDEILVPGASPKRIGFLGIHVQSDYMPESSIDFCMHNNTISLGRYGPFKKADRKPEPLFEVKNFLFNNMPAEWAFDVKENLWGHPQVIDITDDTDGLPHDVARKNICMYVNEVGHNNDLKQNVYITGCENERSAYYFLKLDESTRMKKGETIELLTNYSKGYEGVRERKGYGWKNLHRGMKSDDDMPTYLERNFIERTDAANVIGMSNLLMLFEFVEFMESEIWVPLSGKAIPYLTSTTDSDESPLLCQQWVALRRIDWLRGLFEEALDAIEKKASEEKKFPVTYPYVSMIKFCKEKLNSMAWRPFAASLRLRETVADKSRRRILEALEKEVIEETCFTLQESVLMPFDPSMWCPIAIRLVKRLCMHVATCADDQEGLLSAILDEARESARSVETANEEELAFESGLRQGPYHPVSLKKALETIKISPAFFLDHTTIPKGYLAAVVEKLAYIDALVVAGLESHATWDAPLECGKLLMTHYGVLEESNELQQLRSVPRSLESVTRSSARVNKVWYKVWQIGFIAHIFATKFLAGPEYSIEKLSREIEVDSELLWFAAERGIRKDELNDVEKLRIQKTSSSSRQHRHATALGVNTAETFAKIEHAISASERVKKRRATMSFKSMPHVHEQMPVTKSAKKKASGPNPRPKKNVAKKGNNAKASGSGTWKGRPPAKEIWEGTPDEPLEGGWPDGWTKKIYQRQSGATKGDTDGYWFTPEKKFKLRSMKEVGRFMKILGGCVGDEVTAWSLFKKGK